MEKEQKFLSRFFSIFFNLFIQVYRAGTKTFYGSHLLQTTHLNLEDINLIKTSILLFFTILSIILGYLLHLIISFRMYLKLYFFVLKLKKRFRGYISVQILPKKSKLQKYTFEVTLLKVNTFTF